MEEAAVFHMLHQLRGRLATLILDGGPAPRLLANDQDSLIEDFLFRLDRNAAINKALRIIDLKQVDLPEASHRQTEYQRILNAFKPDGETLYADTNEPFITTERRNVYDTVVDSVTNNLPRPFMIDVPAGRGKTFTEKVIAARLRGQGKVVLIIASTLMRKCDLIIFDEVCMMHKYCVEALEITLRDLRENDKIFGGTILMSGDWRQNRSVRVCSRQRRGCFYHQQPVAGHCPYAFNYTSIETKR